jgi:hypothetical protein
MMRMRKGDEDESRAPYLYTSNRHQLDLLLVKTVNLVPKITSWSDGLHTWSLEAMLEGITMATVLARGTER